MVNHYVYLHQHKPMYVQVCPRQHYHKDKVRDYTTAITPPQLTYCVLFIT